METPPSPTPTITRPGCRTSPPEASLPLSASTSSLRKSPTTGASSSSTSTARLHLATSPSPSRTLFRISSGFPISACLQPATSASATLTRKTTPTTSSPMVPRSANSSTSSTPVPRRVSAWTL
nr:MAG: hypothetical protein [Chemarfal virus 62]